MFQNLFTDSKIVHVFKFCSRIRKCSGILKYVVICEKCLKILKNVPVVKKSQIQKTFMFSFLFTYEKNMPILEKCFCFKILFRNSINVHFYNFVHKFRYVWEFQRTFQFQNLFRNSENLSFF